MPRSLHTLPKAHLHLHFTGSMRPSTLLELATRYAVRLPDALLAASPPQLTADNARGWFRFQRLYDIARSVVRSEADMRRIVVEAAEDDRAEGSGWLDLQIEPTSYAAHLGGLHPTLDIVLAAAAEATELTGVGIGLIVAGNRTKHPYDARTLARLAVRYADRGVVGFGLSNDEHSGRTADFAPAFRIAADAGLLTDPHGGELAGASNVWACVDLLGARRIGHGVRSVEDPRLLDQLATRDITLEVCPASNVALGVAPAYRDVPVRELVDAGVGVALAADNPLLFGSRLVHQYEVVREHLGFDDDGLADLARRSILASTAPADVQRRLLSGVDAWLTEEPC